MNQSSHSTVCCKLWYVEEESYSLQAYIPPWINLSILVPVRAPICKIIIALQKCQ